MFTDTLAKTVSSQAEAKQNNECGSDDGTIEGLLRLADCYVFLRSNCDNEDTASSRCSSLLALHHPVLPQSPAARDLTCLIIGCEGPSAQPVGQLRGSPAAGASSSKDYETEPLPTLKNDVEMGTIFMGEQCKVSTFGWH